MLGSRRGCCLHGSGVQELPEGLDGGQLVVTGSVRCAIQGSLESHECTEEFVGSCWHWSGEVVVSEIDGVADGEGAGVLFKHLVAPVVFSGGAYIESVPTAVVP